MGHRETRIFDYPEIFIETLRTRHRRQSCQNPGLIFQKQARSGAFRISEEEFGELRPTRSLSNLTQNRALKNIFYELYRFQSLPQRFKPKSDYILRCELRPTRFSFYVSRKWRRISDCAFPIDSP